MEQISFVFYTEWSEYFEDFTNEEIGELMRCILEYKKTGNLPGFSRDEKALKLVFTMIKNQLDRDADKWQETKKTRSEAGKRGASKRWKEEPEPVENSNAINENGKNSKAIVCHTLPLNKMAKMAVNVNVNEDVNDNVNANVNVDVPEGGQDGPSTPKNKKIPTLNEVQAYCNMHYYKQDAVRFFEYYSQRNWIISGKPVTDWTKLCDAWESHEKPQKPGFKPAKDDAAGLPELPVCSCGNKAIYAQSGVCRCSKCIDHYWELDIQKGMWVQINKVEIGLKIPR